MEHTYGVRSRQLLNEQNALSLRSPILNYRHVDLYSHGQQALNSFPLDAIA